MSLVSFGLLMARPWSDCSSRGNDDIIVTTHDRWYAIQRVVPSVYPNMFNEMTFTVLYVVCDSPIFMILVNFGSSFSDATLVCSTRHYGTRMVKNAKSGPFNFFGRCHMANRDCATPATPLASEPIDVPTALEVNLMKCFSSV